MQHRLFEFIWLRTFEQVAKKLLTERDWRDIEAKLCEDLEAGALMPRTGEFRKMRLALAGRESVASQGNLLR